MKNCVYRFLNKDNEIIYIGKAVRLKARIDSHNHLSKECYAERVKIEYVEFNTEDDALFVEQYLISKHKPKYNKDMVGYNITLDIYEFDNLTWNEYVKKTRVKKRNTRFNKELKGNSALDACRHIELEEKWLNIHLFTSNKDALVDKLDIYRKNGDKLKWSSIKKILRNSGYNVKDTTKRHDGKTHKVSIITLN